MNVSLKVGVIQSGELGYKIEQKANFPLGKLSRLIHGVVKPTEEDKKILSKVLGRPIGELFPETSGSGKVPA